MPLGSAEIEQIGTYVRANLAEWMEDIVGPRLLGRTARVEDELTFQRELISSRFEAVDKRFEDLLHRFDAVDKRFEDMHEISLVCDALGIDPWELIGLANRHPRVDILKPGPGVGGHCIAVDPWFIVHSAPERTPLMQAARQVNSGKPRWVAEQVLAACQGIEHPTIACLGLAYKADVGDLRESPAIAVIERLQKTCPGRFLVVEPHVDELPSGLLAGGRTVLVCLDHALAADVILLLTDHEEFRRVDRTYLAGKRVIDTRGIWRDTAE